MNSLIKRSLNTFILLIVVLGNDIAAMGDDPLLTKLMSELEYLPNEDDGVLEWDVDAWVGRDLQKVWLKSSGEFANSEIEEANLELVYSRAVFSTWDQQFGIRHDFKSDQDHSDQGSKARNWVSFGYIGTATYFVDVDARVFFGEESSAQLLVELEREIMLTQQWVLTPEMDIVANGRTQQQFGEGSGLSEIEFSVRLGYESNGNRKIQPFIGLTANQTFAGTRRFEKAEGNSSTNVEAMFGVHFWF